VGATRAFQRPPPGSPEVPFSVGVKRVLNSAMIVADELGHHRIRPEHLLLALLDDSDSRAAQALRHWNVERQTLIDSAAREVELDDSPQPYRVHGVVLRISHE
jgi:ATP-dependent Clp protease ATP-binding subunit ClpA